MCIFLYSVSIRSVGGSVQPALATPSVSPAYRYSFLSACQEAAALTVNGELHRRRLPHINLAQQKRVFAIQIDIFNIVKIIITRHAFFAYPCVFYNIDV